MFNSTGIFPEGGTPENRRTTFNLRRASRALQINKSPVLSDLVLATSSVQDILEKSSALHRGGVDVVSVLLDKYSKALESITEENRALRESITDERPLPTVGETQFNTASQRLTVGINRLIDGFGSESARTVPTSQSADLLNSEDLLQVTSDMVQKGQLAGQIQRYTAKNFDESESEPK